MRVTVARFLMVAAVFLFVTVSARAIVYVNMQFDEQRGDFYLGDLVVEGQNLVYNRDYQNFYGEYNGFPPGPPYVIQGSVRALNKYYPDGTLEARGTISFESGGLGLFSEPFNIYVSPEVGNGWLEGQGGVSFVGSDLDPITLEGFYHVYAGSCERIDPESNPPYSFDWTNTCFRGDYHSQTNNAVPLEILGGNATIENCTFATSDLGFAYYLSVYDENYVDGIYTPFWNLTIRNCRFQGINANQVFSVFVRYQNSVTIEDCHFANTTVLSTPMSGLVEKTSKAIPTAGEADKRHPWKVYYLGFARQGWTESARQFANQAATGNWKGENWRAVGMQVLDLDQVDEDLKVWTV